VYNEKHYTKSCTAAAPKAFKADPAGVNKSMINGWSSKPRNKHLFLNSTDQASNLRECYYANLEESSQNTIVIPNSQHMLNYSAGV